jgi:hypothetical protein
MRIRYTLDGKMRSLAWLVGAIVLLAIGGGIIVDIDHPIAWLLALPNGRFLMSYFAVAGGVLVLAGVGFLIACLCRYIWLRLLRKEVKGKIVPRPYLPLDRQRWSDEV